MGLGVLLLATLDAPAIQMLPSVSKAAEVATSLFVLPNLIFHSGAPEIEKVEIKPSLVPPIFPAIHVELAASVVPINEIELFVKSKSLTCSLPV